MASQRKWSINLCDFELPLQHKKHIVHTLTHTAFSSHSYIRWPRKCDKYLFSFHLFSHTQLFGIFSRLFCLNKCHRNCYLSLWNRHARAKERERETTLAHFLINKQNLNDLKSQFMLNAFDEIFVLTYIAA